MSAITVRDYFAAQALVGMLLSHSPMDEAAWLVFDKRCWAEAAYAWADAMLTVGRSEEGEAV
jgi:hypothetical protein